MPDPSRLDQYFTNLKNEDLPPPQDPPTPTPAQPPLAAMDGQTDYGGPPWDPPPPPPHLQTDKHSPQSPSMVEALDRDILESLHPVDREAFDLAGTLPNLPLIINPAVAARLTARPLSVHTIETTASDRPDCSYRASLLKRRMPHYLRAVEIYAKVDGGFNGKNSIRLRDCRKKAWFVQNKHTKKVRVASSRCKLRWCPICRDVSRQIVTHAVGDWLDDQAYPKMITFTLKHTLDPLEVQIKKLYDSFRKIRQRAYFKKHVTGGVWFFQIKQSCRTGEWHPHMHCLVAGTFLPHAQLKKLWLKITGDSTIVDIRPVIDRDSACCEVARYATSPADLTTVDLDAAYEIYEATKSKRICGSWGSAKGLALRPTPAEDRDDWQRVADFFFVNVRKDFDPDCKAFWKCYQQDRPWEGPDLQDPRELFKDELSFLLEQDPDPPDWRHLPLLKHETTGNWASGFYDKSTF